MATVQQSRLKTKETVLRAPRPSAGLEAAYRAKLTALTDEMARSILYWVRAAYNRNEPEITDALAMDESPAAAMRAAIAKLRRRWLSNFDTAAKELADYFATAIKDRSDAALKAILKKGGISVEFRLTKSMNDVLQATIGEQISLIKSIPAQYLTNVEGIVMRGVSTGRDLGQITKDLQEQHGVTRRRASLIARDQTSKASANLDRVRRVELKLYDAIWCHSAGGHVPRVSHVKAGKDKLRFDIRQGAWIDGEYILPGQKIGCKCFSRPVIKGVS